MPQAFVLVEMFFHRNFPIPISQILVREKIRKQEGGYVIRFMQQRRREKNFFLRCLQFSRTAPPDVFPSYFREKKDQGRKKLSVLQQKMRGKRQEVWEKIDLLKRGKVE